MVGVDWVWLFSLSVVSPLFIIFFPSSFFSLLSSYAPESIRTKLVYSSALTIFFFNLSEAENLNIPTTNRQMLLSYTNIENQVEGKIFFSFCFWSTLINFRFKHTHTHIQTDRHNRSIVDNPWNINPSLWFTIHYFFLPWMKMKTWNHENKILNLLSKIISLVFPLE